MKELNFEITEANNEVNGLKVVFPLWHGGGSAFRRKALWESLGVRAVIVDHVILLHPFHSLLACGIKLLWVPLCTGGGRSGSIWTARRCSRRPDAGISIEVPIGGSEGSLAPVCLDKPTSCCPVICIPETGVYPHGLVLWVWNTNWLRVLELPDGGAIHREAETEIPQMSKSIQKPKKHKPDCSIGD